MIETFTDRDWDQAVRGAGPVIVSFRADWCVPCRTLDASLDAVAAEGLDVRLARVDVDASPRWKEACRIQGLPTLVVFRDGQERLRRVGLLSQDDLASLVARVLRAEV